MVRPLDAANNITWLEGGAVRRLLHPGHRFRTVIARANTLLSGYSCRPADQRVTPGLRDARCCTCGAGAGPPLGGISEQNPRAPLAMARASSYRRPVSAGRRGGSSWDDGSVYW